MRLYHFQTNRLADWSQNMIGKFIHSTKQNWDKRLECLFLQFRSPSRTGKWYVFSLTGNTEYHTEPMQLCAANSPAWGQKSSSGKILEIGFRETSKVTGAAPWCLYLRISGWIFSTRRLFRNLTNIFLFNVLYWWTFRMAWQG